MNQTFMDFMYFASVFSAALGVPAVYFLALRLINSVTEPKDRRHV